MFGAHPKVGSPCFCLPGVVLSGAVTIAATLAFPGFGADMRRGKPVDGAVFSTPGAAAPLASMLYSASPQVTKPGAVVARFSVDPLPWVAAVVGVARHRAVYVARIGGRHGP